MQLSEDLYAFVAEEADDLGVRPGSYLRVLVKAEMRRLTQPRRTK